MGVSYIVTCCFYLILQFVTINTRPGDHDRNPLRPCKYLNDSLTCYGNLHDDISYPSTISELKLSNLTIRTLDLNIIVQRFPNLKLLVVENGEVSNVIPPEVDNVITELVLGNLKIKHIHRDFVQYFPFLKSLHLEKNFLSELSSRFHTGTLDELYIKNNRWNCSRDLSWAIHLNKSRVCQDLTNITCKDKLFSSKSVLLVAQYKKLPSYALDNALMKNPNMPKAVRLFLSGNPWKCDCVFTPVFQELVLQKYSFQIDDLRDVKCSYMRNDENSLKPIINLSRSSVCIVSTDFSLQEGLDLLNAVLASLIIFILGKLAYDYYHFKKSGKLPWIVSRMP
ncbi:protein halfway isoform X2 [Diabrotica virgifera virgifera]|uniref:Protein singed wings 2 n=1 Tax=Diabrotica virgifera virgifera TaxID=50390 RepID=A0ABM5KCB4_DIAVI|nr:protein halfway isoform X2 [Diabrotica virgifera virgifera]